MSVMVNPKAWADDCGPVPDALSGLYAAPGSRLSLVEAGEMVTRRLGFESFLFGMTIAQTLDKDARIYWCSSAPKEWCEEYDHGSYVEIDPRAAHVFAATPMIWDRSLANGDAGVELFFDRAAVYGICSGVCLPLRVDGPARAMMSLNSSKREADRLSWTSQLGTYLLFATHFSTIFSREVVRKNVPPLHHGAPLSRREIQCLSLATKGQTSADIAFKLDITERTVNFHFSNIVSKLDAVNRSEAVAIGVARGIVSRLP